jgi:hypothetical protein
MVFSVAIHRDYQQEGKIPCVRDFPNSKVYYCRHLNSKTVMANCAYCHKENKMTGEHVIPSFIYKFQRTLSKSLTGWNEAAGRMLPNEFKVKDVCAECNNDFLGLLDHKGKRMLEEAGIMVENYENSSIILKYDFNDLMRWLAKISFNSTRTDGVHSYIFEPYVNYILKGHGEIPRSRIALLGYFAAPERLSQIERTQEPYVTIAKGKEILNPFHARISYGRTGDINYLIRIVIFGPLIFFLLVFNETVSPGEAAVSIRRIIKENPGAMEIKRHLKLIKLNHGYRTWRELYQDQILRKLGKLLPVMK